MFPGTFGYDNMANSIGHALQQADAKKPQMSPRLIHEGWSKNYVFWRDRKPFESSKLYKIPFTPLGDERRNLCAQQSFDQLPKEEQTKDVELAECLQKIVDSR